MSYSGPLDPLVYALIIWSSEFDHNPCTYIIFEPSFFQSLKSRGYVTEQFAWRHFYWYLTNEGIQYLRDFLHLPAEIVPATLKRQTRPETARPRPKEGYGKHMLSGVSCWGGNSAPFPMPKRFFPQFQTKNPQSDQAYKLVLKILQIC